MNRCVTPTNLCGTKFDMVGDLSLIGRGIGAHIVAVRPSHAANCEMARRIKSQMHKPKQAAQTFAPPPSDKPKSVDVAPRRQKPLFRTERARM